MNNALVILADAAPAAAPAAQQPSGAAQLFSFVPLILIFVVMFYLMYRSNKKEQKRREEMISSVRTGDKVLTVGGLMGMVANIKDDCFVLKIADNVKVEVAKSAISSVSAPKDAKEEK